MTERELFDWRETAFAEAEAEARGITHFRYSKNPDFDPPLWLIEGWNVIPADLGPIRWQLAAGPRP